MRERQNAECYNNPLNEGCDVQCLLRHRGKNLDEGCSLRIVLKKGVRMRMMVVLRLCRRWLWWCVVVVVVVVMGGGNE
jgi:hypothetical protein